MTGHRRSLLLALLVVTVGACSSPPAPAPASGSSSSSANAPAGSPGPGRGSAATPEAIATARASLVGDDATLLKQLGGTYLCDQRIYPQPPGPHITAWEWSFTGEPAAIAEQLAAKLPGAIRDGGSLRFEDEQGSPGVVVDVRDGTRSLLQCEVPAATRTLVVVSQR